MQVNEWEWRARLDQPITEIKNTPTEFKNIPTEIKGSIFPGNIVTVFRAHKGRIRKALTE